MKLRILYSHVQILYKGTKAQELLHKEHSTLHGCSSKPYLLEDHNPLCPCTAGYKLNARTFLMIKLYSPIRNN